MIALPAIDLREGACVQLVGGSYENERVRLPDPLAVARRWIEAGFSQLHVVDLDAATGVGANETVVADLLALRSGIWQVGGGVRTDVRIETLFAQGAARVLVGTRALEDRDWLADQALRWPGRLAVALEIKRGKLATHGWSRTVDADLDDLLGDVASLPLAAVFVTAVDMEGRLAGCDLGLVDRVRARTSFPIIASGGVTTMADLRALAARGVWAAVIGTALYTGRLDAVRVAAEFGGIQ
jgi:phosphoribosylformimino-5-aminoimidazole carboxamide ribotide isomerase